MTYKASPWEVQYYGAEHVNAPPGERFQSIEEQYVYWELDRRHIPFVYQWRPSGGDIAYTAGREERSADFYIPALQIALNPTSTFTHPDPSADLLTLQLFRMLGIETYFIPDYEIVPQMGGDVALALDKIPGLAFFGENRPRKSAFRRLKRYGQPPKDVTFKSFRAFN